MKSLYIICPVYNEAEILQQSINILKDKLKTLLKQYKLDPKKSQILLVDDGSTDTSWSIIKKNKGVKGAKLSRNQGHQAALLAGYTVAEHNKCDIAISLDVDLQDDLQTIDKMLNEYFTNGAQVVLGARKYTNTDTAWKRGFSNFYYKLINYLSDGSAVKGHADFRLLSKKALSELLQFSETNLYLRGLVPLIGFKQSIIEYERNERIGGEPKYTFRKLLDLAFNGITSFSTKLLQMISFLGALFLLVAAGIIIYSIVRLFMHDTPWGWTFLNVSIWLCSGTIMLSIGIVGQYIGKIFMETKQRPKFIIEELT